MFAGDKSKPAADASYRNLLWENFHVNNSFDIGTKKLDDTEIGIIDSWGPFFRVSFDLIIHSFSTRYVWSGLFFFQGYGTRCSPRICDDEVPALFLNNQFGFMQIKNTVIYPREEFDFKIELSHWYNIIIEQKSVNGKVIQLK